MAGPIITLTTDFGEDSPYVAAMKGVILGNNPAVRLVDLGHQVPPQDVRYAAFFLETAIPYWPAEALHVVVVDPGVGSERAILYVEVDRHRLLVPDNGCWTGLVRQAATPPVVYRLTEPGYWRQPVSATFHGRDIFAPVAAHLSLGVPAGALGRRTDTWVILEALPLAAEPARVRGVVEFVDHFGNLISNIPADTLRSLGGGPLRIMAGDTVVPRQVRTYAEAAGGELVALVSSGGRLEIAVSGGSASARLRASVGTQVLVEVDTERQHP